MNYLQIRDKIRDGDLIAVRSKRLGLPILTRIFTRSPYTHTAVAVWLEEGLWFAEMNAGGNVLVPASQYSKIDFDVFTSPAHILKVRIAILETLRIKIKYDVLDLIRVGLRELLSLKLPTDTGGMICSAYTATIYRQAGWDTKTLPNIPSPADMVNAVGGLPRLNVRV